VGLKPKLFEIAWNKKPKKKSQELISKVDITTGTDYVFKPKINKHIISTQS
jgi:hypothetical protein